MFKQLNFNPSKSRGLAALGRSGVDLYPQQFAPMEKVISFTKHVGGSPANTAVQAAKMGLDTAFIGKISRDHLGAYVKYYLNSVGVDTSHLTMEESGEKRQSLAIAEQPERGRISYFFYRQDPADLYLDMKDIDKAFISQFKALLISGASLCRSPAREAVLLAMEYAQASGVRIIFDPDYRKDGWNSLEETSLYYHQAAKYADIIISTREEFDILESLTHPGNDDDRLSAEAYLNHRASLVCIKHGENGANVFTSDSRQFHGPVMPARVYKTLGAGDSFCGTFIAKLMNGHPIDEALKYAAAAASITISGKSCSDSMPDLVLLDSYMQAWISGRIESWDGWKSIEKGEQI